MDWFTKLLGLLLPLALWKSVMKFLRIVKVTLTPTSGPSAKRLLAVKNQGGDGSFHAQCEIIARRNDNNPLHNKRFDLKWEHTDERSSQISYGESRNLLIATAEHDRANGVIYMRICELLGKELVFAEDSLWNEEERSKLPEYDLEISIFSDKARKPFISRFTVQGVKYGGLVMKEIKVSSPLLA